ncbi:MAG: nitroreductase family protein, partial [Acidimicrobiales bacterium]|nr:nitroreductase family protein [Acidimicrobiales bacterium]
MTEATQRRASIRSFLPDAVSNQQIRELLEVASRAPSGGNVQPWKVYVLNGESM